MNRLSAERRALVLSALVNGNSIRATCRITGTAKNTVVKLLEEVGAACLTFQRAALVNLPCTRIQRDEIRSFVGAKERTIAPAEKGNGRGDVWTWTALCADTKIVPCWHLGAHDADAAAFFIEDLASRLAIRVQLTTDGHRAYLSVVEKAFGWNGVDYATLVKLYDQAPEGQRRYRPPRNCRDGQDVGHGCAS